MTKTRFILPPVALLLVTAAFAQVPDALPQETTQAYQRWMLSCLDALQQDLPQITASAEAAADLYLNQNYSLVLSGADGFCSEAYGRAGGIMPIEWTRYWRGEEPGVVLYALREEALPDDYQRIGRLVERGCRIILFARKPLLDEAERAGIEPLAVVDIHAAEHGGLFPAAEGEWVVPTDAIARMMAEWTWIGEFVAACTRQGKMPTMWKSMGSENAAAWNDKWREQRYHDSVPAVVAPGVLGRAYLEAVRNSLRALYSYEVGRITQVAQWAVEARAAGRTAYTFCNGHGPLLDPGCPHDPQYFRQLSTRRYTVDPRVTLQAGDVILYIGQGGMPVEWGSFAGRDLPGDWRKAGVRVAWSFGNLWTREFCRQVAMIGPDEPFLDQHFPYGDGAVWIDGYDIPILPVSGITSEAVLWLATAEVHGRLQAPTAPQ